MSVLQPLVPAYGDKRTELVKVFQRWLNEQGAKLVVDGKYGPGTKAAVELYGYPQPRRVPPLCAWTSREWSWWDTKDGTAKEVEDLYQRTGFRPARLGLFLNSHGDGPVFKPFGTAAQLKGVISELKAAGVGVDLTAWIWPSVKYLDGLLAYVLPILKANPDVKLDLDTEMAWASGGRKAAAERAQVVGKLYEAVDPKRVSINDYAFLQGVTEQLLVCGVQLRPQAYSVGESNGLKASPDNILWPGETQSVAMSDKNWGEFAEGRRLGVGLAAYDPIDGMPKKTQITEQVAAALWFEPQELWFWQMKSIDVNYGRALAALQGA
jgi:hypothetical protein